MTDRDPSDEIRRLKERLADLEASTTPANAAPGQSGKVAARWIGYLLLGLVAVVAIVPIVNKLGRDQSRLDGRPSTYTNVTTGEQGELPPSGSTASSMPAVDWDYNESEDSMSGRVAREACAMSMNQVSLDFPYEAQRVQMCVRNHPRLGRDVYLRLPLGGQFRCSSFQPCVLKVKFDDGQVQAFSAVSPSDGSSDVVFVQNDKRFVGAMREAEMVAVEAEFFRNGLQSMRFKVSGWDAARAGY